MGEGFPLDFVGVRSLRVEKRTFGAVTWLVVAWFCEAEFVLRVRIQKEAVHLREKYTLLCLLLPAMFAASLRLACLPMVLRKLPEPHP